MTYQKQQSNFDYSSINFKSVIKNLTGQDVKNGHIQCQLHGKDNNPSCQINNSVRGKGFYCYTCHARGDPIKFVQEFGKKSFNEAVEYLGLQDQLNKNKFIQAYFDY